MRHLSFFLLSMISHAWGQTPASDSAFLKKVQTFREAEVIGRTPTLRSGLDKKIFSVSQSLVSTGGNAADLLQNIPGLLVDGNGNISLRGATKIKVLIDGRQSIIGGGSVAQILQSIPAASIEKIEVIATPSAKYDAEGEAIINIILKKGGKIGRGSSVTASAGTRNNYNAGTSINYRIGKANIYGNYSFQRKNTYSNGFQYMTFLHSGDPTYYSNELFPSTTINNVHIVKTGIDYSLSKKDLVSLSGLYNSSTTDRHEYLSIDNLTKQQTPTQLSNRTNNTNGWNTSWGLTLDLAHKFKKPAEELNVDFAWSTRSGNSFQTYSTNIYNVDGQVVKPAPAILQDSKGGRNMNYNIQLDYILPLGKEVDGGKGPSARLELGARTQLTTNNNRQWDENLDTSSGTYRPDYSLINFFRNNNQIHAIYINYKHQLKAYTIQVGLRAEAGRSAIILQHYDSVGALINTPIDINTTGLYPSLFVTRQLKHGNQLQLAYTRRISRPTPRDLNPLPDVSDPVNYDVGNPALRPENIHSIELTFKNIWPGGYLTSGFYYNQVNNVIKHIQSDPVNDITYTLPENLRRAINTGVELITNVKVTNSWSFTANLNIYDRINAAAPQYGIRATTGLSWNANVTNDFSITKKLSAQLRADYKAAELNLQDRYRRAYGFDAGAKYDFAHNKATLSFSARDIFNTRRPAFLRVSDALLLDWQRITYSARASLTFAWRLGSPNQLHSASL